ncbi:hypothetical protein COCNU_05G006050 [Cocos nucifera]|uniref:Uncharacterized protein n=1 Tax=Cocos nucifera TaxID=13894 RepID=A0A8K0I934_COCNU|nr:hypothetical protein COCNU_05G006050 [Cocos nucifera]
MNYWSEVSISSHAFDVVSQEQLEEASARPDQATAWVAYAEERTSHLKSILSIMLMRLSSYFEANFAGLEDMLADVPALAPTAPPPSTPAPRARAPSPDDDDDDIDLRNF